MAALKLTKKIIDSLPQRTKVYIEYDRALSGFGCRVSPSGVKSWIVEYRAHAGGRRAAKQRITLGRVSTITPDAARDAAKEILARVRLGEDVAGHRAILRDSPTIAELAERYLSQEIKPTRKPRTATLYEAYLRNHILPELGSTRARDLSRTDVLRLHRKVGATNPVTANRILNFISGLFRWAAQHDEVPEALRPAKGITKFREEPRERYLTIDEFERLGCSLRESETVGLPWQVDDSKPTAKHAPKLDNRKVMISLFATAAIRLLLLTGCRLREILHLRWTEIDFDRGMIFLPDSKTGRRAVLLPGPALAILYDLPRAGEYVIAGRGPDRPRHDLQRPWAAISKHARLDGVRLHDLRHSFAAIAAGNGLGLPIIGKLLGHRNVETTSRYAHLDQSPLRRACELIGNDIALAMGDLQPRTESISTSAEGIEEKYGMSNHRH
jgi:integrase